MRIGFIALKHRNLRHRRRWLTVLLLLLCAGPATHARAAPAATGRAVADEATLVRTVEAQAPGHGLLWSAGAGPTAQALRLIGILHDSAALGLDPEDYGSSLIGAAQQRLAGGAATPENLGSFDALLSRAAVRFVTHLHYGRIAPEAAGFELPARTADLDVPATVLRLASAPDPAAILAAIEPHFYHYELLKAALVHYQALAAQPALPPLPVPARTTPKPGDAYAGAAQLRTLLLRLGDLAPAEATDAGGAARLDPILVTGIRRFQQRHGLTVDGALGSRTFAALTTPLAARVRQIELTLERWRWLPALDTPPIIVNIPQFQLFAFRTTADRLASIEQMPVIVGKSYPRTQTPVFVGTMKYVIFHPYWDVPHSITVRELLPQLRAHPDYLARNHFEVVRGETATAEQTPTAAVLAGLTSGELRVRQRPGDDNALGPIKFVFPNAHDVYLHSTPAHQLFAQSRRAFSHG